MPIRPQAVAACLIGFTTLFAGCSASDELDPPAVNADNDFDRTPDASTHGTDAAAPVDTGSDDVLDGGVDTGSDAVDAAPDLGDVCDAPFRTVSMPMQNPPFAGTAYVTSDLITSNDPTAFVDLSYVGQEVRTMFDRRVASFITVDAHVFNAEFGTTRTLEVRVNPEFSQADAETEARRFAEVIGRIPAFLLSDVDTISINAGMEDFGGGNRDILVHTEQAATYVALGSLEEVFVHEASHASMDAYHAADPLWLEAVAADGVAVSTYARDNPTREDVAETIGPYLAARLRPDRVDVGTVELIRTAIPNRLQYFDCIGLTMDVIP